MTFCSHCNDMWESIRNCKGSSLLEIGLSSITNTLCWILIQYHQQLYTYLLGIGIEKGASSLYYFLIIQKVLNSKDLLPQMIKVRYLNMYVIVDPRLYSCSFLISSSDYYLKFTILPHILSTDKFFKTCRLSLSFFLLFMSFKPANIQVLPPSKTFVVLVFLISQMRCRLWNIHKRYCLTFL